MGKSLPGTLYSSFRTLDGFRVRADARPGMTVGGVLKRRERIGKAASAGDK
jgi:hypothetical protein